MEKSIVLSCFNIIIMPIIVNYVFFNKLYGANGAAGIAFDYHVSALTTNLIMKLVGPLEMLLRIALAIKTFRNWLIKFKHRPTAKTNKHRLM